MPTAVLSPSEQILGIRFFNGNAEDAVAQISASGGLLVAPSGTCFERFLEDEDYRRAITSADVVLPDSGLMVLLWRILRGRQITRVSGLAYLKHLIVDPRGGGKTTWVLPNEGSRANLLAWSVAHQRGILAADCYVAPVYGRVATDEALLRFLEARRPKHVVIAIGAGAQEKLGWYLRENARSRPAIHCIGGALGFITGDQIAIPVWADRFYLGWFLRFLAHPRLFLPRLWKARVLPGLILRHGSKPPFGREKH